ncbi:hypothetical protein [Halorhabdus amylolytica]|uniref:hypothetical protein n=1 Tax=Halorhabdus amylolytica TaxID=2559573 RepID=UPI0010AAF5FE|nr:hypothetical protein [Halorhabdus amylolytica]
MPNVEVDLTGLQEDILTLAVEDPDLTNEEIADRLDCSPQYVSDVRNQFEHKVDADSLNGDLSSSGQSTSSGNSTEFTPASAVNSLPSATKVATGWPSTIGSTGPIGALILMPFRFMIWLLIVGLKFLVWLIVLPFYVLKKLLGK